MQARFSEFYEKISTGVRKTVFDPTIATDFTPLPEFKLNYPISQDDFDRAEREPETRTPNFYFARSSNYFIIKHNAQAKDQITDDKELPIEIRRQFDLSTHSEMVRDHINLYTKKSDALVKMIYGIITCVTLALVIPYVPFIPFTGTVALLAWGAAFYMMNLVADLYHEYHDALLLLCATCNWILGPKKRKHSDEELFASPVLNNHTTDAKNDGLMDHLFKVLSKTQIKHLIEDKIEAKYLEALEARDARFKPPIFASFFANNPGSRAATIIGKELEQTAMKQRGVEIVRCLFGLNRGTAPDFARVIANAIPDFLRAAYNAGKAYFTPDSTTPAASVK